MAEMIEAAVREANAQIVTERGFKLVREPKVTLPDEQGAVEQVIEGKSDLAYTVAIEILPPIELADFKGIKLERLTAEVTDAEVDEALATHRRAEPAVRAEGRGRQGRERRPRHHRLHRQDRRRAVRGRHRRRRRRCISARAPSSRASRSS